MMLNYFKAKRSEWFPRIKNWKSPQNKLRYKHPNDMTMVEWIWFSPICYQIVKFGQPSLAIVFSVVGIIAVDSIIARIILGIIIILMAKKLYQTIDAYKYTKGMNLYDDFLRDI